MAMDPKSGYCKDSGIYYSKRVPSDLPPTPQHMDIATHVFSRHHHTQKIAFIDGLSGKTLTYSALRHNVRALACGLHGLGIRKGDVVLIISPNSIALPCIHLAILSLGAIASTANPLCTEADFKKQAEDSKPVIIFTPANLINKVRATQLPVILIEENTEEALGSVSGCISTLNLLLQSAIIELPSVEIKQEDTATLIYSSGTSGKSKGVISTHRNFIAGTLMMDDIEENKIYLCTIPMSHLYGFFYPLACVGAGATLVVLPRFDLVGMFTTIQRYKVNCMPVSPPLLALLNKSPSISNYDLSSLQIVHCAGAPLRKEIFDNFTALFPDCQVKQGYGMTETNGPVSFFPPKEEMTPYESSGSLSANLEGKIVDTETGEALPPNHRGELWLRGPTIMKGYFGNDEATASTINSEGWMKTGDLCYIDEEGFIFVVDRLKEVIKYKAYQVPPTELEELLLSNPEIIDSAVIPYPDEDAGQIPMAFVVKSSDSTLCKEDVINFVAKQVAPYKKIRRVVFVTSIPRTPSGKILRKDLIQRALDIFK